MSKILTLILLINGIQAADLEVTRDLNKKLYDREYSYVIDKTTRLLRTSTSDVDLMSLRARALYHDGQIQPALDQYKTAYQNDPANDAIAFDYASMLSLSGNTYQAAVVYRDLYQKDSTDVSVLRPMGNIAYEAGEHQIARNIYVSLIGQREKDYSAHRMLAKCYSKLGENKLAAEHYQIAHDLNPGSFTIIYEYARHEYLRNNYDGALGFINLGEKKNASSMKLMLLKADIYFKQNEFTLAIPIYNRLVARGLDSEDVYKRMAFSYYQIGAYYRAVELFEQAIELGDNDAATYYYMGKCLEATKDYEEANGAYMQSLINSQPNFLPDLHESMGNIHAALHEYPDAIHHLKKALELNPDSYFVLYFLADAYDNYYEDKSVALDYFRRARQGSISPRIDEYIDHRIAMISKALFLKE